MSLTVYRKRYFKSIWHRFKLLFLLFILFIIIWIILFVTKIQFIEGDLKNWFISFSDDIIFFGTGLLAAVLGSRMPEEESFERRISSLSNGAYADKDAEFFLRDEIERLMSYNKKYTLTFILQRFDAEKKHLYILTECDALVVNMCQDDQLGLKLRAFVSPGPRVEGQFGYVTHYSVKREGFDEEYFIREGHRINLNDLPGNSYELDNKLPINGNSKTKVKLCHELWIPLNGDIENSLNWHFHKFTNYSESVDIIIKNELRANDINFQYKYKERQFLQEDNVADTQKTGKILAGKELRILTGLKLKKNDKFELFFSI